MRRRTLFKRAAVVSLSLVPGAWTRSRDDEPAPASSYFYVCIGDVPDGATVSHLAEHGDEIEDSALDSLERSAEKIHEPGDLTLVGWNLSPDPIDYTALDYSRPPNAPDGYYVDVGEKVVLIVGSSELEEYPEFTE
jgi:hypothetical protein